MYKSPKNLSSVVMYLLLLGSYSTSTLCHSTSEITFTINDMFTNTKNTPPSAFTNVFNNGLNIKAWPLSESNTDQPVIVFSVPKNFDPSVTAEVDVHLLVDSTASIIGSAAFTIGAVFAPTYVQVGGAVSYNTRSSDFGIVPAVGPRLRHICITVPLSGATINPQDWAFLVFKRVKPLARVVDYQSPIYIAAVSFRHGVN